MIRVIGKIDLEFSMEEARDLYEEMGNLTNKDLENKPRLHEVYLLLNGKFGPDAGELGIPKCKKCKDTGIIAKDFVHDYGSGTTFETCECKNAGE